jgi:hypothetical protein
METTWSQIVKVAKGLGARKMAPTHFLVLDISCAPDVDKQAIGLAFAKRMNGSPYEVKFSPNPGDSVDVMWCSAGDSPVFWAFSKLEESHIQQLTSGLVEKVAIETRDALDLGPKGFTCTLMIIKNTGVHTLGESMDERATGSAAPQ